MIKKSGEPMFTLPKSESSWHEQFVVELRMRDVPGTRVGDLLAEVDSHCADSGQSAAAAFGDPIDYARSATPEAGPILTWRTTARVVGGLSGVLAFLAGSDAVAHHTRAPVSAGNLASLLLIVIFALAVVVALPWLAAMRWRIGVGMSLALTLAALPQAIWRAPVAHLPGAPLLGFGLAALALTWWPISADRLLGDRVVDPITGGDRYPVSRGWTWIIRYGFLVILVVVAVVLAMLPAGRS